MSIYSSEHFESKLERNTNVVDKVPEGLRKDFISHINWARELTKRIDSMDPEQKDETIMNMIGILDDDYEKAGFELQKPNEETQEETKAPTI